MQLSALPLRLIVLSAIAIGCGSRSPSAQSSGIRSEASNSPFLMQAGENAKSFFFKSIEQRGCLIVDARDPRLYPNGGPYQPPTPADQAVVSQRFNGTIAINALLINRPGYLEVKEFPSGNFVTSIGYGAEVITYSSRFDGMFASVTRNTSGLGWNYVYYVRGFGNQVTPAAFDAAVSTFLTNSARYVCP